MPLFLHTLPTPLYMAAIALSVSLYSVLKSLWLLVQAIIAQKVTLGSGSGLLGGGSVAVPSNTFPPMFLLSQWRCVDARCRGGD
jgi:hypothetical protein